MFQLKKHLNLQGYQNQWSINDKNNGIKMDMKVQSLGFQGAVPQNLLMIKKRIKGTVTHA